MEEIETIHYDRDEDYFVYAQLCVKGKIIENVPCKIFLPEYNNEKPTLKFRPTQEQFNQIIVSYEGSFEAKVFGFDNTLEESISSPYVYFSKMKTKYWGLDYSESTFEGEPQDFQITKHIRDSKGPSKTSLILWLSPNAMLDPAMCKTSHYTGNIEYKRVRQLSFSISDQITIILDNFFKEKKLGSNEIKQWSYLVARTEIDIPIQDVSTYQDEIIEYIDAFLAVASLGSRTRTEWIGWQASNQQTIIDFYRGNFTFPTGESEPSFDQGLVRLKDFYDFLAVCYKSYLKHPSRNSVKQAIISVVPGKQKELEESFLTMFAGLEALILDFRKRYDLEYVMPEAVKWKFLKQKIKIYISETFKTEMTKEQRNSMYNKLEELNRIPLQIAFNKFCEFYKINISDLWPLFGRNDIIGLVDIRNKLIHGDQTLMQFHNALLVAEENLRFMLERILVNILGWNVDKTEVSMEFLKTHSTAIREMHIEQDRITKYLLTADSQ